MHAHLARGSDVLVLLLARGSDVLVLLPQAILESQILVFSPSVYSHHFSAIIGQLALPQPDSMLLLLLLLSRVSRVRLCATP